VNVSSSDDYSSARCMAFVAANSITKHLLSSSISLSASLGLQLK
jgi:hypothetical protein